MFTENEAEIEGSFKFLLASRALRSVAIILVNLSLSLYLKALGYGLIFIGVVYFIIVLFNVFFTLALGYLGDRMGYARAMILGELFPLIAFLGLAVSENIYVIIASAALGGITGTPGGMRGAFSPGMTSYIASNWPEERERIDKLSKVFAVSSISAIGGSLLLAMHGFLSKFFGPINSFRVLFGTSFFLILASLFTLSLLKERRRPKKTAAIMKKESFSYSLRVIVPNVINGLGVGIAFPLLPLWFELNYNVSASVVGLIFTAAYAFTALGSYFSGSFMRSKKVRAITVSSSARLIQGLLLIALAFSPFLILSVAIYSVRSFIAGLGSPIRSAINVRGISSEDYGTASAVQGIFTRSSQLTSGLSGYLMSEGLELPLLTGGFFQVAGALAFYALIRSWEKKHSF